MKPFIHFVANLAHNLFCRAEYNMNSVDKNSIILINWADAEGKIQFELVIELEASSKHLSLCFLFIVAVVVDDGGGSGDDGVGYATASLALIRATISSHFPII